MLLIPFVRVREEERLPVLVDLEVLDYRLRLVAAEPVDEGHDVLVVDVREALRAHFDSRDEVEQYRVALDERDDVDFIFLREVGGAVHQRVGSAAVRELRRVAVAELAEREDRVPGVLFAVGGDSRGLPDVHLGDVRSGHVAAADELDVGCGDFLKGLGGGLHSLDSRGVVLRAEDYEVVVHDVAAVLPVAFGDEFVLERARVDDDHVEVPALRLFERRARSGLFDYEFRPGLGLEGLGEQRDYAGVDGADGARELYRAREGRRAYQKSGESYCKLFHKKYTVRNFIFF